MILVDEIHGVVWLLALGSIFVAVMGASNPLPFQEFTDEWTDEFD